MTASAKAFYLGLVLVLAALVATAIHPYDRTTWLLEVAPVLIAIPILLLTRAKFPLTRVLYGVIIMHCLVLIVGGAYSYARVPIGFWIQEILGATRNPYDKIGHFMQGVTPTLLVRELFIRLRIMARGRMLAFVACSVALAFSACYELVEWWTALLLGQGADEFLGTQGYVWDTQSDMMFALIGSVTALLLLSRTHDREINGFSMGRP